MKKVVKLTESDLMRIVKRVIKENEGENMIRIPKNYSGVVMELGKFASPEEIIDAYNTTVEEGIPLVSYSEDGFFTDEDGQEIEEYIILDELNYSITGGEEDDTIEPSPKRKKFGDGGESEFLLTDNIKFKRLNGRLVFSYQPSKIGGGIKLSDEQKEMLIDFLSK